MMALVFIMALMATNWELFKKSKSKSEKINLELLDLLASPQVKIRIETILHPSLQEGYRNNCRQRTKHYVAQGLHIAARGQLEA